MKSLALWQLAKEAEAIRELDHAVSAAMAEMHLYPLYRVGARLLPILGRLGSTRDGELNTKAQFVSQLTSMLGGTAQCGVDTPPSPSPELVEPLTDRQLEILRLIGTGLGNKALAEELHISLSTAKWHVHNIFDKLGVKNRTAAVAYARNNNLI
jgi:LuxR family maltose regulon positive regulatory protein